MNRPMNKISIIKLVCLMYEMSMQSIASMMFTLGGLVPRPLPVFQCYTQKNGRAWYQKMTIMTID